MNLLNQLKQYNCLTSDRKENKISIRYANRPSGGLGNRLFQFNFISQLAIHTDTRFEFISPADLNNYKKSLFLSTKSRLSTRKKTYSSSYILEQGTQVFDEISKMTNQGYQIVLEGTYLGDFFFDFTLTDPKSIILLKNKINFEHDYIALHFRGGDFESWNKRAILDFGYYFNAVADIDKKESNQLPIYVVTDDESLESVIIARQVFKNRIQENRAIKNSMISDFALLRDSKHLISSPSTFAIWAGILGRQSSIYHSSNWLGHRCNEGDKFWFDLSNGGNSFYKASFIA